MIIQPRVLVVDDEIENRENLVVALKDDNPSWELFGAGNVVDGIALIRNQFDVSEPINLLITDLVMESDRSGINLIESARHIDPLIMSILFTAREESLDRYAALENGAFDVVEKNIRGLKVRTEINVKARAALRYQDWSQRINFLRRYFDPRVFDTIESDPSILEPAERLVTICFWDIRGFSLLCEILKKYPALIAGFTRDYCDVAAKCIFANNGLLDKFLGDGVLALYGVLNHKADDGAADATSAVNAAIQFRSEFRDVFNLWNDKWSRYTPQKIELSLACGIHTGEAIVGNMGTSVRDQFTALGPNVNFASRLESRSTNGSIIVSQSTERRIRNAFNLTPAGIVDDIKNIPGRFDLFSL